MNLRHHCGVLLEGLMHDFDQGRFGVKYLIYGEIWVGGVAGVGDVDINEASDGKVGGVVSLSWTEIVFEIGCLGYRRVHTTSEEN